MTCTTSISESSKQAMWDKQHEHDANQALIDAFAGRKSIGRAQRRDNNKGMRAKQPNAPKKGTRIN